MYEIEANAQPPTVSRSKPIDPVYEDPQVTECQVLHVYT